MNAIHEYALLFAVAVPVLAIVGLNVFLFFGEERGTLLMPGGKPFEAPEYSVRPAEVATATAATHAAANDDFERKAA